MAIRSLLRDPVRQLDERPDGELAGWVVVETGARGQYRDADHRRALGSRRLTRRVERLVVDLLVAETGDDTDPRVPLLVGTDVHVDLQPGHVLHAALKLVVHAEIERRRRIRAGEVRAARAGRRD